MGPRSPVRGALALGKAEGSSLDLVPKILDEDPQGVAAAASGVSGTRTQCLASRGAQGVPAATKKALMMEVLSPGKKVPGPLLSSPARPCQARGHGCIRIADPRGW